MSVPRSSRADAEDLVRIKGLTKTFKTGELHVPVLRGVDLTIPKGAFQAVLGPSGCGKTTLLNLLGALDEPTSGAISVGGVDLGALGAAERTRYRQEQVGFVFQFFNLMPLLTALENVELGIEVLGGVSKDEARSRAVQVLERVGLKGELGKFPSQLSGGQQQRVAIARALAKGPKLVLCDEPTGNLDSKTSASVLGLMLELNEREGTTFVIATHSEHLASKASHVVGFMDGRVTEQGQASASQSQPAVRDGWAAGIPS